MLEVLISSLPDGYDVVHGSGVLAWVVYGVSPDSIGTWVSVRADDAKVYLFPDRTYKHHDLAKRLGLVS
jgi:hypothetical protein